MEKYIWEAAVLNASPFQVRSLQLWPLQGQTFYADHSHNRFPMML